MYRQLNKKRILHITDRKFTKRYGKLLLMFSLFCGIQNAWAKNPEFLENALAKNSPQEAVEYLQIVVTTAKPSEKREIYVFMGKLQQQTGLYMDAYASFASAIALDNTVPNAELRLDAAVCAMGVGEVSIAESVLDSVLAINSENANGAKAKLYAVWCGILKAPDAKSLSYPVGLLKNFLEDESMKCVEVQVLFSLWWLTNDDVYAARLKKDFAGTGEASIASGAANVLPVPYWYFIPRQNVAFTINSVDVTTSPSGVNKTDTDGKVVWQQVGLFRAEENAQNYIRRLKESGFEPEVLKQKKASGNIYTVVVVRETDGSVGQRLKNAGFECYPIYE